MEKCNKKEEVIKSNFDVFKLSTNDKFAEITKELLKPKFTPFQIMSMVTVLIGYMASIMIYVSIIKSDVRVNTLEIKNTKEITQLHNEQYDKIIKTLEQIQIDIAILKSQKERE